MSVVILHRRGKPPVLHVEEQFVGEAVAFCYSTPHFMQGGLEPSRILEVLYCLIFGWWTHFIAILRLPESVVDAGAGTA